MLAAWEGMAAAAAAAAHRLHRGHGGAGHSGEGEDAPSHVQQQATRPPARDGVISVSLSSPSPQFSRVGHYAANRRHGGGPKRAIGSAGTITYQGLEK